MSHVRAELNITPLVDILLVLIAPPSGEEDMRSEVFSSLQK